MAEFRVSDSTELHALQAALIEAKLPRLANDLHMAASPIVAELAERVNAACNEIHELPGSDGGWRQMSRDHGYWGVAISRALADQDYLRRSDLANRQQYVRWLLAPFRTDEPTVSAFLADLESIFQTRRWYHLWMRSKNPFDGGLAFLRERVDGSFVALDADRNEITSSAEQHDVGQVLLERGLEPFGYFVEDAPAAK
jgi:hypothetical protein